MDTIRRGDTFTNDGWTLYQDQARTVPFDLTGWAVTAQLRRTPNSARAVDFTVVIDDAAAGEFHLTLPPDTTANLDVGVWVFDVQIADLEDVHTIVSDEIVVEPDVTRSA
jgi:hypothetical protein